MKKFLLTLFVLWCVFSSAYAQEQKDYDPQNTMLALNMAIVSVNRILTTEDRLVLEWEYDNIINRLALGNIESDSEMKRLYTELLDFITGKRLRQEDAERIRASQAQREREAYYKSMNTAFKNLRAPVHDNLKATQKTTNNSVGIGASVGKNKIGGSLSYSRTVMEIENLHLPIISFVTKISINTISSMGIGYYGHMTAREQVHREISEELWKLKRDEIEACNQLQKRLLDSSWGLVRKYGLPNEYRLTQENVKEFLSILDEKDSSKRLGRLKFIERKFQVYPPYWFYRAYAALDSGNYEECRRCFEKFNEVWRPILDYDPYKLEAAKFRIQDLAQNVTSEGTIDEIKRELEVVRDYTPMGDWKSNIFSGIFYYVLGEKEKGMDYLEFNIMSNYEKDISGMFLAKMKDGNMSIDDIPELTGKLQAEKFLAAIDSEYITEGIRTIFESHGYKLFPVFENILENENFSESRKHFIDSISYAQDVYMIGMIYEQKADYLKAVKFFTEAALFGHVFAQIHLADLYYNGGNNLEKDYMKAYLWYQVIIDSGYNSRFNHDHYQKTLKKAKERKNAIDGEGWFTFAKGSDEERENVRKEAQKIKTEIYRNRIFRNSSETR